MTNLTESLTYLESTYRWNQFRNQFQYQFQNQNQWFQSISESISELRYFESVWSIDHRKFEFSTVYISQWHCMSQTCHCTASEAIV